MKATLDVALEEEALASTRMLMATFTVYMRKAPRLRTSAIIGSLLDGDQTRRENIAAITWNACGMEEGGIDDMIAHLEQKEQWDVVMMQEGPYGKTETYRNATGGHAFFTGACPDWKRSISILIHKRWLERGAQLSFTTCGQRIGFLDAAVGTSRYRFTSAHAPHREQTDDEYEAFLAMVEETVLHARRNQRMSVVGIDANAILGARCLNDDGSIIGDYGIGFRNERGFDFASWVHGARLTAAATLQRKEWGQTWTHLPWGTGNQRQINFILCDEIRHEDLAEVGITDILDGKSDHRAPYANISAHNRVRPQRRRTKVKVGWAPQLDEHDHPAEYHRALDQHLSSLNADEDPTLAIVTATLETGTSTSSSKREHSREVAELSEDRRNANDPDVRKDLSKQLWKALRRQRRQRHDEELTQLAEAGAGMAKLRRQQAKRTGI